MERGKQKRKEERFNLLASRENGGELLPGISRWDELEKTSLGRRMTASEREALRSFGYKWLKEKAGAILDVAYQIAVGEIETDKNSGPQVNMLRCLVDKILVQPKPEEDEAPKSQVTRIVIGAPLQRLVKAGATVAAEIREEPARE